MRYELLVQARSRDERFEADRVEKTLAERGAVGGKWKFDAGELEVSPVREGEQVVAIAFGVPLSHEHALIRAAVSAAADLARATESRVIDPQLADTVNDRDVERVVAQFERTAKYAGEMLGLPEAVAASFAPPPETGLKPLTKVILGLGAFLLFLYVVLDKLLTL